MRMSDISVFLVPLSGKSVICRSNLGCLLLLFVMFITLIPLLPTNRTKIDRKHQSVFEQILIYVKIHRHDKEMNIWTESSKVSCVFVFVSTANRLHISITISVQFTKDKSNKLVSEQIIYI